jgi:hypothetical protein
MIQKRASLVCGQCGMPDCTTLLFRCTGCSHPPLCEGEVAAGYRQYGRRPKPGYHLFVRGYGELWDCGPLVARVVLNEMEEGRA